ncbi:hypothetical protein KBW81_15180 [Loktanella salsilacus]|uniref:hypothetical protein n=1 Tax=Loktanella salsilacus TaxID=195913 RepID=UPI0020B7CE85|nr:hypothetical protein [Loktanella salsilacus]UTH48011.1 hypothetical protein KBW81_15180 [Loktanella salsilacus]
MWLGDVAKFPDSEQYYLMSESRPPEFSVGSEFFDGQISCKISDQSIEDDLLHSRTLAIDSFIKKYQISIAHLDEEVLDLAIHFFGPSTNSFVEWECTSNTLNRIHVESLSNPNLGKIQQSMGIPSAQGGPMRQLSAIIANLSNQDTANSIMLPFFTIYDLRIAFQHLTSADKKGELLNSVLTRLNLSNDASIKNIYDSTVRLMNKSYKEISGIVEAAT